MTGPMGSGTMTSTGVFGPSGVIGTEGFGSGSGAGVSAIGGTVGRGDSGPSSHVASPSEQAMNPPQLNPTQTQARGINRITFTSYGA